MLAANCNRWCAAAAAALAVSLLLPAAALAQQAATNRRVHVVLIGVTDDEHVGRNAQFNIDQLKTLFEGGLKKEHLGSITVVKGKDVTAQKILATIDGLKVAADEALFVYCHIHGGYDPDYQYNDASQGHFLWLPGGDLMRKELWQHLRARKSGLTVLLTESCYQRSKATPFEPPRRQYQMVMENRALVSLFLRHRGYIDLNGCSKDEYSWNFGGGKGSFFTNSFVDLCYPHPGTPIHDPANLRWADMVKAAGAQAGQVFLDCRKSVLNNPDGYDKTLVEQMRGQHQQRPAILQMSFEAEPTRPKVLAVTVGKAFRDQLTEDDSRDVIRTHCHCKTFSVRLEAGHTYTIDMESKQVDAYLRLESERGTNLAEDDDSGGNLNARIRYRAMTSGTHYIVATTYKEGTGEFVLRVQETGPMVVGAGGLVLPLKLTLDDPRDRTRTRSFHKVVDVQLTAGRTYVIDLQSATLDSYLRLEDAAGKQLAFDDDSGGNLNARLEFRPTQSGTYRLIATTYVADTTGDMLLQVKEK